MLKKRFIRTTVKIEDENKVFISKDGRFDKKVSMRQDFEVKSFVSTSSGGLQTAKIFLFNLNEVTRKLVENQGLLVLLEAGWKDQYGKIFEGRISSVGRTKPTVSNPDIATVLYCVSGVDAVQLSSFSETIIRESLPSFLSRLAASIGKNLTIDDNVQGNIENTSFNGDAISVAEVLADEFNFDLRLDESSLIVGSREVKEAIKTYSPESGLLDIPIITELGVDLKVFLDPFISPGDWFELSSKFANFNIGNLEFIDRVRGQQFKTFGRQINNNRYQGSYRALELIHSGSSHDEGWATLIKGQGLYNINNIDKTKRLGIA